MLYLHQTPFSVRDTRNRKPAKPDLDADTRARRRRISPACLLAVMPMQQRRVALPGEPTTTVVGGPSGGRGADPVAVPGRPTTPDRHPCHNLTVAPGSGDPTLDPASTPLLHWRPLHGS